MALFTDAEIVTIDDLLPFEASLIQVASSHGINVEKKVALATSVVGQKLMLWLEDAGAADPQWMSRRVLGLSTVVVTPVLARWLYVETLSLCFAEAYGVQLNSRFEAKWKEYKNNARSAADQTIQLGIGIVFNALPKPMMPLVSVQQGTSPAESLFVQSAWIDADGNEGSLSPVNGLLVNSQSGITVQMAEGVLEAPADAAGWNVYMSANGARVTRQNGNPLSIGSTWTLPTTGMVDGDDAGDGQLPNSVVPISRQIRRG